MQEASTARSTTGAPTPSFKIAFAGPEAVGKTSIVNRLHGDEFSEKEPQTIGASYSNIVSVHHLDGAHAVCFEEQFWDTAGQERFADLLPIYARNSHVIVLTFDATMVSRELVREHVGRTAECHFEDPPLLLIALNKVDKLTDVGRKGVRNFAKSLEKIGSDADFEGVVFWGHLIVCETSAKTGEGIADMHHTIRWYLGPKALIAVRSWHLERAERDAGCC